LMLACGKVSFLLVALTSLSLLMVVIVCYLYSIQSKVDRVPFILCPSEERSDGIYRLAA
jgi:hypothetical protein